MTRASATVSPSSSSRPSSPTGRRSPPWWLTCSPAHPAGSRLYYVLLPLLVVMALAVVVFIVIMTNAERRITIQYARRGGGAASRSAGRNSYLPLKVNMSGRHAHHLCQHLLLDPRHHRQFYQCRSGGPPDPVRTVQHLQLHLVAVRCDLCAADRCVQLFLRFHPVQPDRDRQQSAPQQRLDPRLPAPASRPAISSSRR